MSPDLEKQFLEQIAICRGILFKICRSYCPDREAQDDLYQDIVLNAWNAFPRFGHRSKFSTWLYRVALNTALSDFRKNRRNDGTTDLDGLENMPAIEPDEENITLLYRAIEELNPAEKSLAILYLDDLSYREISEITGLSESNVGVRLFRVKEKIRKWFGVHADIK